MQQYEPHFNDQYQQLAEADPGTFHLDFASFDDLVSGPGANTMKALTLDSQIASFTAQKLAKFLKSTAAMSFMAVEFKDTAFLAQ